MNLELLPEEPEVKEGSDSLEDIINKVVSDEDDNSPLIPQQEESLNNKL